MRQQILGKDVPRLLMRVPRFAILVVITASHQDVYRRNLRTIECYARMHKYAFLVVEPGARCISNHVDFMFQRHCEVASFLERSRGDIDWVLLLDADHAVVNANHTLESYVDQGGRKDVIHGLRFHNNEVVAGYYFAKNTEYTIKYLREWAGLDPKHRNTLHGYSGMNSDNGALHWLLLQRLAGPTQAGWTSCLAVGSLGKNYAKFRECFHRVLMETRCVGREWDKISILPRGQHVAYDGWVTYYKWSDKVFMHHAMKNPPISSTTCCKRPLVGRLAPRVRRCTARHAETGITPDSYYTTDAEIDQLFKETTKTEMRKHFQASYNPASCVQNGNRL
jgi:hypothetical protein